MAKEDPLKTDRKTQRFFASRDIHLSLAFPIVLALLGGLSLFVFSFWLLNEYGLNPVFIGVLLVTGYAAIALVLSVFFGKRFVGPFRRLEYEMRNISNGGLEKRLYVRSGDDAHVKHLVHFINVFISRCEEMSNEYKRLNGAVSSNINGITAELSREKPDSGRIMHEIDSLQSVIRQSKGKW